MDELVETLAAGFSVSNTPNDTATAHPRFSQYKQKRESDQHSRRLSLLERQKQKRDDWVAFARNLADSQKTNQREPRYVKDQLMLSEWLVEVPDDIASAWYMVPSPEGKRSFIVASYGVTRVYARSGYFITSFQSLLPGGNYKDGGSYSLLDCIWCELEKTYYILDLMCWHGHPVFDCETEFRFGWLQMKLMETPGLGEISEKNQYRFRLLPYYNCDAASLKSAMEASQWPFTSPLDGLLFYHKFTHYTAGSTPLVGWLKPFMLPEILNIEVPDSYLENRPKAYVDAKKYVDVFNERQEQIKQKRKEKRLRKKGEKMDTADDEEVVEAMQEPSQDTEDTTDLPQV